MALFMINDVAVKIMDVRHMLNANDNASRVIQLSKKWNFKNLKRTYPGRKKEIIMEQTRVRTESILSTVNTKSMADINRKT